MQNTDHEYLQAINGTLKCLLTSDKTQIDAGQKQLELLQTRSDYSLCLLKILLEQTIDFSERQLSGVLLKQCVESHWSRDGEKFKEPELDTMCKTKIRDLLPYGLADSNSKIRTVVAAIIAAVAHWDWPELWPNLFDILIEFLSSNDLNAVHGSIKTLNEFIEELSDIQMPQVAPTIMPQIYNIFTNPQHFHAKLRARSIEIFCTLANIVGEMAEYDKTAAKKYLNPYLHNFMQAMTKTLASSDADCNLRKNILKAYTTLVRSFPKKQQPYMNEILSQVWSTLVESSNTYTSTIVNCKKEDRREELDIEGEEVNFEELVYQVFEFILTLKEKSRYKDTIRSVIGELVYYVISYMQITEDQIDTWENSPDTYIEEEDEETYAYSVRISGNELLESIASDFKQESCDAICKAVMRLIEQSHQQKQAQNAHWWKIQESCFAAMVLIKDELQELASQNQLNFDLNGFILNIVLPSLSETHLPFLVGRALFFSSKFSKLLSKDVVFRLLDATTLALNSSTSYIIRVSAMKAVYSFCEELNEDIKKEVLVPLLPMITEGLVNMTLENSESLVAHLTLETLSIVLSLDERFVESVEGKVAPLAIAIFLKQSSDPLMSGIVTDIFKIFIQNPLTNERIEQRLLPTLASILSSDSSIKKDLAGLLVSTLDLLTNIIRSSIKTPLSTNLMNFFVNVVNLCLRNDDTGILQSGGECLRAYFSKSPQQVISWKSFDGQTSLQYTMMVISHMLSQDVCENSCSFIGRFINTVLKQTGNILGDNIENILKAVLSRMQSSKVLLVQQSLIMVFARLMHDQMDNVLTFLSSLPGPSGKPVLEFVMSEWVSKQNSFVGPYDCKVSILALAKLLEYAIAKEDTRFEGIHVKGDRIINPIDGVKTRSKAKTEQELYTQVPLLVKVYKLLVNELQSQIEESKDDDEKDYDDTEEDYDENDEDDGESNGDGNDSAQCDIEIDADCDKANTYLSRHDMLDEMFDNEDVFEEDDADALDDPLMKINLLVILASFFMRFLYLFYF